MSARQEAYAFLEARMLKYRDLANVPVVESAEPMVPIVETKNLLVSPIDPAMSDYTGDKIYVRKSVAGKLGKACLALAETDPDLQLQVVYGYRALAIQKSLFEKNRKELSSQYEGEELLEAVHRRVAVPEVSGHPTGGAVDLQIARGGMPLGMGTAILEFTPDSYTFSPFISGQEWTNRWLLRCCMIKAGFAPFDGEWWHFSYGDREWAKSRDQPNAIYGQIVFSAKEGTVANDGKRL